jgi:toxin ParE1/3/4
MKPVDLSPDAQGDLLQIWDYLSGRNEHAATRILAEFTRVFNHLAEFPEMGRLREDLEPGYRSFAVRKYVIFYRLTEESVEVSRIVHGSRDLGHLLKEGESEESE